MQGIGYVELCQVASTVILAKHMPGIGFVDKMYAKNRFCRPKVDIFCQLVNPGVF